MNWDSVSFDWNQAKAFVATAHAGSFTGAARLLHLTQPTLGRQISALEGQLGVTLFERAGRQITLTDAGRDLLEPAQAMLDAAAHLSLAASGQSQTISGLVRISASDVFAVHVLAPLLKSLRSFAPALEVEIVATNDLSDLPGREADIALRHVRPIQPDLVARLVHTAKAGLFAGSDYFETRDRPTTLEDLSHHDFISLGNKTELVDYLKPLGVDLDPTRVKLGSTNGLVAWDMVRRGYGIAIMSSDVGFSTDGVEQICADLVSVSFPVWLVAHRELHTARRIRLVFDFLAEHLPKSMI